MGDINMNNKARALKLALIIIAFLVGGCSSKIARPNEDIKNKQHETLLLTKETKMEENKVDPNEIELDKEIEIKKAAAKRIKTALTQIDKNKKIAYLTFDDTMSENTVNILDTLKEYDIRATFFPNLNAKVQDIEFQKQMLKRMVAEGHVIGNHTASHSYSYVYSSIDNYMEDTEKLNEFIYDAAGVKPNLVRFPGGSNNQVCWRYGGKSFMNHLITKIKEQGYQYFDWNVSSADSAAETVPTNIIIRNVLNGSRGQNKVIILMHQSRTKTTSAEALPKIIKGLESGGYSFEGLSKDSFTVQFTK
jgi:peptidoglycan/xylan/chitin deacetylase (PgdA/CDA1 family)